MKKYLLISLAIIKTFFSLINVCATPTNNSNLPPLPINISTQQPKIPSPNEQKNTNINSSQESFIDLGGTNLPKINNENIKKYQQIEPKKKDPEEKNPYDESTFKEEAFKTPQDLPPSQPLPTNTQDTNITPSDSKQPTPIISTPKNNEDTSSKENSPPISQISPKQNSALIIQNTQPIQNNIHSQKKKSKFSAKSYNKQLQQAINQIALPNFSQDQFVSAEAQLLLLPNDDIVLGKLTQEAKLNLMPHNKYIKLFLTTEEYIKTAEQRKKTNLVLHHYQAIERSKHNIRCDKQLNKIGDLAFSAIEQQNLITLKALLDNYNIIQIVDINNNSLLHKAVMENDYYAAKTLLMRGINFQIKNIQNDTAIEIARKEQYQEIIDLIE